MRRVFCVFQMAKRIKTLEKDCYDYRVKYEKCNKALLDMASDRQAQDRYIGKSARQLTQLQKLCRTLQVSTHKESMRSNKNN